MRCVAVVSILSALRVCPRRVNYVLSSLRPDLPLAQHDSAYECRLLTVRAGEVSFDPCRLRHPDAPERAAASANGPRRAWLRRTPRFRWTWSSNLSGRRLCVRQPRRGRSRRTSGRLSERCDRSGRQPRRGRAAAPGRSSCERRLSTPATTAAPSGSYTGTCTLKRPSLASEACVTTPLRGELRGRLAI